MLTQTHTHEYSSSFLVSLAMQSNSKVPQSSVLVPFKICMCEFKKSGNVNRPLMAHSVLEGEAGECRECKGIVPAFPSSRGAVGGETLRLEVGREGSSVCVCRSHGWSGVLHSLSGRVQDTEDKWWRSHLDKQRWRLRTIRQLNLHGNILSYSSLKRSDL